MSTVTRRSSARRWAVVVAAVCLAPALAELAKVHLKDSTVLRGDVELTETELVIRNEAGETRYPHERVAQVEWLEPAKSVQSGYQRRLYELTAEDVDGHFALAEWLVQQQAWDLARKQCEAVLQLQPDHAQAQLLAERIREALSGAPAQSQPAGPDAEQTATGGVPPPPPLDERDILRLKLSELPLDGPAERVNVRFSKPRDARAVEDLVREEMGGAPGYVPGWGQVLSFGEPWEKLQIVLKVAGLKYADRIDLRGHPRVFGTYRQRVLPLVARGCVRSGCHGGQEAHAFRFPVGSRTSDKFIYTSFLLLDQMQTAVGPMIDRGLPEESALLRYMLPAEQGRPGHPPTERGRVTPVLRGTLDPRYRAVVEWIRSLRSPHPDYALDYKFPAWFEALRRVPAEATAVSKEPAEARATEPAEDRPEPPKSPEQP